MKNLSLSIAAVALLAATVGVTPTWADHHAPSVIDEVITNMEGANEKILALAEAVPAEQYSWKPNVAVRSFSEVLMHAAGVNLLMPSMLGAALPEGLEAPEKPFALLGEWEKNITAKDDVIAKLKESFEYVGGAIRSIEDLDTKVAIFFPTPSSKRSYVLIIQSHAHEHLGQLIAYTRSMGIAPPWSQPPPPSDEGEMDDDQ
jgi:uncharacterized damage-inducible protein DinB